MQAGQREQNLCILRSMKRGAIDRRRGRNDWEGGNIMRSVRRNAIFHHMGGDVSGHADDMLAILKMTRIVIAAKPADDEAFTLGYETRRTAHPSVHDIRLLGLDQPRDHAALDRHERNPQRRCNHSDAERLQTSKTLSALMHNNALINARRMQSFNDIAGISLCATIRLTCHDLQHAHRLFDPYAAAFAAVLYRSSALRTMSAALPLGVPSDRNNFSRMRPSAATCFDRAGPLLRSTRRASLSFFGVQSSWMNSGKAFSPRTRLAKMIDGTFMKNRSGTAKGSTR